MNPDQAAELGKRIINTMRPTPALPEWVEVLEPLDFDAALRTFRALRDRIGDGGLRIATFHEAFARASGTIAEPARRRRLAPAENCEWCRGCGYEDGPPEYETVNGEPHAYTTLIECRCTTARPIRSAAPAGLFEDF